jgi:hypothetical protein
MVQRNIVCQWNILIKFGGISDVRAQVLPKSTMLYADSSTDSTRLIWRGQATISGYAHGRISVWWVTISWLRVAVSYAQIKILTCGMSRTKKTPKSERVFWFPGPGSVITCIHIIAHQPTDRCRFPRSLKPAFCSGGVELKSEKACQVPALGNGAVYILWHDEQSRTLWVGEMRSLCQRWKRTKARGCRESSGRENHPDTARASLKPSNRHSPSLDLNATLNPPRLLWIYVSHCHYCYRYVQAYQFLLILLNCYLLKTTFHKCTKQPTANEKPARRMANLCLRELEQGSDVHYAKSTCARYRRKPKDSETRNWGSDRRLRERSVGIWHSYKSKCHYITRQPWSSASISWTSLSFLMMAKIQGVCWIGIARSVYHPFLYCWNWYMIPRLRIATICINRWSQQPGQARHASYALDDNFQVATAARRFPL